MDGREIKYTVRWVRDGIFKAMGVKWIYLETSGNDKYVERCVRNDIYRAMMERWHIYSDGRNGFYTVMD